MGVPAPNGVSASGKSPLAGDQANGVVQGAIAAVGAGLPFSFWGSMNMWLWGSLTVNLGTTAGSLVITGVAAPAAAGASVNSTLVPPGTTLTSTAALKLPTYTYYGKTHAGIAKITDINDTTYLLGATVGGLGIGAGVTVLSIDTPGVPGIQRGTVTISAAPTLEPQNDSPTPFTFALAPAGAVLTTGADPAAQITGPGILFNATVYLERTFDGAHTWLPCNLGGDGTLAKWTGDGATTGTPVSVSFVEPERQILYRLNATAFGAVANTSLNYRISATGQAALSLNVDNS